MRGNSLPLLGSHHRSFEINERRLVNYPLGHGGIEALREALREGQGPLYAGALQLPLHTKRDRCRSSHLTKEKAPTLKLQRPSFIKHTPPKCLVLR